MECWSGFGGEKIFGWDGLLVDCEDGVGKFGVNFVYRFGDYGLCEIKFFDYFLVYQYDLVIINNWLFFRIVFLFNLCIVVLFVFFCYFLSDDGVWCEYFYELFESWG